jgi:hypothetical protein
MSSSSVVTPSSQRALECRQGVLRQQAARAAVALQIERRAGAAGQRQRERTSQRFMTRCACRWPDRTSARSAGA